VIPNKRRQGELRLRKRESPGGTTLNARIWDEPCTHPAALYFTDVQQAHDAQHALQVCTHDHVEAIRICVNRP